MKCATQAFIQKNWQGAKAKFQTNVGGGQAGWSSGKIFRLSDIAFGAFLGTEVSVLGLGFQVQDVLWNEQRYKHSFMQRQQFTVPGAKQ